LAIERHKQIAKDTYQEALLPQTDRATRRVSQNFAKLYDKSRTNQSNGARELVINVQ